MKRAMWKKIEKGSLVKIFPRDANGGVFLLGQILIPGVAFYMQVHDMWLGNDEKDLSRGLQSPVLLIGETTDAELCREQWCLAGLAEAPSEFLRPYSVVNTPDGMVLRDFDCQIIRPADDADLEKYGYQVSVSPTVFTTAVTNFNSKGRSTDFGKIDAQQVAKRSFI